MLGTSGEAASGDMTACGSHSGWCVFLLFR